ncbi:MAG: hypothetical protein CVU35_07540 [Betaproteobacteria bacterium HGW-Betaproteobacteria-8]|nr:MAG: hypothetical protein CVU35_07540 [Betaproteobacteria bacterium HGW-Betaproteobacteria-8]
MSSITAKLDSMRWKRFALLFLLPLSLFSVIYFHKVDALAWHLLKSHVLHKTHEGLSLNLDQYRVEIEARPISGIDDDLSGLTYNTETHTLFSVLNGQPLIVELGLDGQMLRKIKVEGVRDMEGITHVDGKRYVVATESDQKLILLQIDNDTEAVDAAPAPQIGLGITSSGNNKDFEGVSWDDRNRRLLVAKERNPLKIIEITGFIPDGNEAIRQLHITPIATAGFLNLKLRDFSSITYHDASGHLVILSDESRMAAEYDFEGRAVSALSLWRGFHGLKKKRSTSRGDRHWTGWQGLCCERT